MIFVKKILKHIITMLYFFFSSFSLPVLLTIAFNYTKGIANNPDGVLLIPFGIIGTLTVIVIDILIVRSYLTNVNNTKTKKNIILTLSFVLILTGILLPVDVWNNFFKCLLFYLNI